MNSNIFNLRFVYLLIETLDSANDHEGNKHYECEYCDDR